MSEAPPGRTFRLAVLVVSLLAIYSLYLRWAVILPPGPVEENTLGSIFVKILVVALIGAIPFLAMAYFDATWRSRQAATVAMVTWAVVFGAFSIKFGAACPGAAAFFFIPLTLGALVGHNLGMFRHPETFDPEELDR